MLDQLVDRSTPGPLASFAVCVSLAVAYLCRGGIAALPPDWRITRILGFMQEKCGRDSTRTPVSWRDR